MKTDYIAMELTFINQDMVETKEALTQSAFSGHGLLEKQASDIDRLPLASLLFVAASLGDYRSERLKPVAVGLELLRLGVEKHYRALPSKGVERNLALVTADYYYAKAISLAAELKVGSVVEYMVGAIADIATAEAATHGKNARSCAYGSGVEMHEKSTSLFNTAAKLGVLLGGCSANVAGVLADFASSLGVLYQASQHLAFVNENDAVDTNKKPAHTNLTEIKGRTIELIRGLPESQGRMLLSLVSSYA